MHHLAARGWVVVAPDYRLSPGARFPAHSIDCKCALAWIRGHIAAFGGDPGFVAVTGGSAGAHIAALIALTYDDAELQPGFEQVDTRPAACLCLHGVYDLADREDYRQDGRRRVDWARQERHAVCALVRSPAAWERASPIAQVRADAPPFFILHGVHDSIVPVAEARAFADRLRDRSTNPVAYAELPGAQHAWDTLNSVRALHTVDAIAHFLEWCVARRLVIDPPVAAARTGPGPD